jgi:hemoglobin-like flavoprotein
VKASKLRTWKLNKQRGYVAATLHFLSLPRRNKNASKKSIPLCQTTQNHSRITRWLEITGKTMNATQTALVQASFTKVQPIAVVAAELFYGRLFELDPNLKPLFRGDMTEQGHKLMTMLGVAVANLTKPEVVMPALAKLGASHASYGVTEAHYETVGSALLWTLEKGLGDEFTSEVKEAWVAVYTVVADTMKAAAREHLVQDSSSSVQHTGLK